MIKFANPLYLGDSVKRKKNRIIRKILNNGFCDNVYLITNPANTENLFDIIEEQLLLLPCYEKREIIIFAIAGSMSEAQELLLEIIEDKIC